jgi:AraC-like DNA-binding protein
VFYTGYEAPSFCLVLEGGCWFAIENTTPRRLERGDFMLLPTTPACSFFSQPDAQFGSARPWVEEVRHGEQEGEPDFKMLGGAFQIERVNASLLLQVLPDIIHVRSAEYDTNRLATIIDLIIDEGIEERAGREAILEHLLKVMLIECFRRPGLSQEPLPAGLLAGMRDPSIASTLRAMHSDVRHGWTVAELSKHAGMSRSSFAEHFGATMGCAPIEYLTRWRMSLAQDALDRGRIPHIKLASDLGYASVSAFSTAFRRRVGCSPGAFARGRSAAASR